MTDDKTKIDVKMVYIPADLVESILCRLPVKPLKRFRCVAKSWLSVIDSERFVKSHLNMSLKTVSHQHLIVLGDEGIFDVNLYDSEGRAKAVKLPFTSSVTGISSSCNGLFLVVGDPLVIWNPYTREFKTLPRITDILPTVEGCVVYYTYGFAHDSENDDYKVVRVAKCRYRDQEFITPGAHIYSLNSNSWKCTEKTFTYQITQWYANINGALHTLEFNATSPDELGHTKIKAFSVNSEKHFELPLPSGISTGRNVAMELHKIEGRLCLIRSTSESGTEVWVMKDYRVRESWEKMFSIGRLTLTLSELYRGAMKPLATTKDSDDVLFYLGYGDHFVRCVFRTEKSNTIPIGGLPSKIHVVEACVESLVSLRGKQVQKLRQVHNDQDKKQDNKKSRNKRVDSVATWFKYKF